MKKTVLEMLNEGDAKICAPMVRCSKLAFRQLVRKYNCDIAFTPMIIATSILNSEQAWRSEFVTCEGDRPLIVQFAANNAEEFAGASLMVAKSCDGVDLNCGCPQRWVLEDGYGACLMEKPELIHDMVRQTRNRIPYNEDEFTISIKCRIYSDIKKTVNFCQQIEKAGVSWIAVHGRTKGQRKEPADMTTIKTIVDSVNCPVVANGDIKSLEDCYRVKEHTGANGVMAARGILTNPALFAGYERTPVQCVCEWIELAHNMHFPLFHQHLMYMCEKIMNRSERRIFNTLTTKEDVVNHLISRFEINPQIVENKNLLYTNR